MGIHSTRGSLLGRLGNEECSAADWEEFVRIYSPQVVRWCRAHGLQETDAADVCQDVLVRFWKQAANFHYDPTRRFRSYLRQVLKTALAGWSARRQERSLSASTAEIALDSLPARQDLFARIEQAYDTELLSLAMREVQPRVNPQTWRAFEMQALEHRRGKDVAEALGISVDLAYAAKHNVQKMIRETIARLEGRRGQES